MRYVHIYKFDGDIWKMNEWCNDKSGPVVFDTLDEGIEWLAKRIEWLAKKHPSWSTKDKLIPFDTCEAILALLNG